MPSRVGDDEDGSDQTVTSTRTPCVAASSYTTALFFSYDLATALMYFFLHNELANITHNTSPSQAL